MAAEYVKKLQALIEEIGVDHPAGSVEVKHFFGGAALYINRVMCVSWSPVGLAFKLPPGEASLLIQQDKASPLKYFEKGHVKRGYALFDRPEEKDSAEWAPFFARAVQLALESAANR